MKIKNSNAVITGSDIERARALKNNDIVTNINLNGSQEIVQSESVRLNKFKGQVAIVTGAASGIGLAISQKLLKEGASVALLDINGTGLKAEFKKYKTKARLFPIDITQQSLVNKAIEEVIHLQKQR